MKHFLLTLLVVSAISANGQTITYDYLKLHQNNKAFHCLVNGTDTVKMSTMSFTKHSIKGTLYTAQGTYEYKSNLKKKVTEIFNSEGQLVGTSTDNKFRFWTVTSPKGTIYKHGYDKDDLQYSVDGKVVIKAKFINDKKKKKKQVELQVVDASVENFELIKNFALVERIHFISEIPKSQMRLVGSMAAITLSVILTVNSNNNSPNQ